MCAQCCASRPLALDALPACPPQPRPSLVSTCLPLQGCDPAPFYLFDEIDAALDPQYRCVGGGDRALSCSSERRQGTAARRGRTARQRQHRAAQPCWCPWSLARPLASHLPWQASASKHRPPRCTTYTPSCPLQDHCGQDAGAAGGARPRPRPVHRHHLPPAGGAPSAPGSSLWCMGMRHCRFPAHLVASAPTKEITEKRIACPAPTHPASRCLLRVSTLWGRASDVKISCLALCRL